jgi:hypothetical protein
MTTIDGTGRPGYMYDDATDVWYEISGKVSTAANYQWLGAHQFDNNVTNNGAITAKLKFNSFLNPAARLAAIPSPGIGLITFVQQDSVGATINRFEYWNGTSWIAYADPATIVTLSGTQTLTNKTLTTPTMNGATLSGTLSGNAILSGNLDMTGRLDIQEVRETVIDGTISANVLTMDYLSGTIYYVSTSPTANFTINLTNAPTDNGKAITVVAIVPQGATGYIPNAFQVAGSAQTLRWLAGSTPTPTSSAGKLDIFNFTLVRRSSTWTVLGTTVLNF